MIEFCPVSRASIHDGDILVLAESYFDSAVLNDTDWILAPYLSKPITGDDTFDSTRDSDIVAYTTSIHSSGMALALLKAIVDFSNDNKHVIIGCYTSNVQTSHLSCLYDIMEDLFVDEDPDMQIGG